MGAVLAFFRIIPLKAWLALGLAAAVAFSVWRVHANGVDEGEARSDSRWQAKWNIREAEWKALAEREEARYASARASVEEDARRKLVALQAQLEAAREIARKARQDLDLARSRYVTAKADAACVVPVGFVLYHNRAASIANGEAGVTPTPDPSPAVADAPSGIALSTVADVASANLSALGECREQVTGWQAHWRLTEAWHASLSNAIKPHGGTP